MAPHDIGVAHGDLVVRLAGEAAIGCVERTLRIVLERVHGAEGCEHPTPQSDGAGQMHLAERVGCFGEPHG